MIYNNKQYYVYLICNKNNTTIYTGITSDLKDVYGNIRIR